MSIFWFSLCFIIKNTSANSKIFDFYFLLVEYWNITYIFTLILSTMKRKIENEHQFCFSDNVAVCDMSKFFCFRRKSKNWIWKIAIHVQSLFFGQNTTIVHRTTQEGGGGVHSYGNFFSLAPSPQIHFPPCAERFFFALLQSCHRVILQESKCKYNVYLPEKLEEASKLLYPPLLFVILTLFHAYHDGGERTV